MYNTRVSPGNGWAGNGVIGTPGVGDGSDPRAEGARATNMFISTLSFRFPEVNPDRTPVRQTSYRTPTLGPVGGHFCFSPLSRNSKSAFVPGSSGRPMSALILVWVVSRPP